MTEPSSGARVRRDPRAANVVLAARYRCLGDETWRRGSVFDVSIGGALISCDDTMGVGQRIELRLARAGGGPELELVAEVLRTVERADGAAVGVRFMQLSPEVAGYIAEILNDALGDGPGETQEGEPVVATGAEPPGIDPGGLGSAQLSAIRLHDRSLYELLGVDASCPDGELESRCEALIQSVLRLKGEAKGYRHDRLRVLHNSLERLRPLWNDPVKRARYDLRWGIARAEERVRAAAAGTGIHAHLLSAIWLDLYPERVREAEALMRNARRRRHDLKAALIDAVGLEPFARRWREQLQELRGPAEAAADEGALPAPAPSLARETTRSRFVTADLDLDLDAPMAAPTSETPSVRGSLADLPLHGLLRSLAVDEDDAEIEVRVYGRQAGLVGLAGGLIVVASFGEARGPEALRALGSLRNGSFVVRYCPPRGELRHMSAPAVELLAEVMPSGSCRCAAEPDAEPARGY